ncbi:MAG TPA: TIGR03668 family PPOX class F420-dependent oxidoreductase [Acidimicrobiales bacterium]
MTGEQARRRFIEARVAHMATADEAGRPHLIPIVFALEGDGLVSAVDHKPKRRAELRRLANIADNPRVTVLVDEYDEDWDRLWWARADGVATLLEPGSVSSEHALDLLVARYRQYEGRRPTGPVVLVEVSRWSGWSAC